MKGSFFIYLSAGISIFGNSKSNLDGQRTALYFCLVESLKGSLLLGLIVELGESITLAAIATKNDASNLGGESAVGEELGKPSIIDGEGQVGNKESVLGWLSGLSGARSTRSTG